VFGSWGGRPTKHGIDAAASAVVNFLNNPIEIVESEYREECSFKSNSQLALLRFRAG